jgi:mannosyltransferase
MNDLAYGNRASRLSLAFLSEGLWQRSAALVLSLVGLLTRLYHVGANGYRSDETYSLWMAGHSLPGLFRTIIVDGRDATPPMYDVLLHLFMQVSSEPWAVRFISVIAGAASVWLAFELARELFDFKIAILSGLLMAISPFSIEYAQVARTYALTGLFTLASIYLFTRLNSPRVKPVTVLLYVICTWAALSTHYLAAVAVVFENLIVVVLLAARRLPWRNAWRWFVVQFAIAISAVPLIWLALPRTSSSTGQSWLAKPTLAGMIRTTILWGTGDPSYGPSSFTFARLASLLVIVGVVGLGALAAWRLWQARGDGHQDLVKAGFVAAAAFVPWVLALAISLFRPIFDDKYLLFAVPFWLILFAWSVTRIRPALLGNGLLAALLLLTALSLGIYYTSPAGEQWREAMAYLDHERQPQDYVVVAPGYYVLPAAFYLVGVIAPYENQPRGGAAVAVFDPTQLTTPKPVPNTYDVPGAEKALGSAQRIWLVTGYQAPDHAWLAWFAQNYTEVDRHAWLGVVAILGERKTGLP